MEKAVRNRWLTNFQPGLVARNRRIWYTESAKSHEMWERKVLFMTLGEKIALLRRQSGQSQEALADRLNVSRQAVSKWESGASVPELDKLLALSEVFGVSTDYLLKEGELAPQTAAAAPEAPALRRVDAQEAEAYLDLVARSRGPVAWGVSFYILCPIPLLFLGVMADGTPREELAGGVGVILLLVCVVVGLLIHLPAQLRLDAYEYLETADDPAGSGGRTQRKKQGIIPSL